MKFFIFLSVLFLSATMASAEWVNGYMRKDGTWVNGYNRTERNSTVQDNFSYKGNKNYYTGETGTNYYRESPSSGYYQSAPTIKNSLFGDDE